MEHSFRVMPVEVGMDNQLVYLELLVEVVVLEELDKTDNQGHHTKEVMVV
jgi:hypothetical protein